MPPPDLGGAHRPPERGLPWWGFVLIVLLGAAAVATGLYVTFSAGEVEDKAEALPVAEAQRDAAANQAIDLGQQVVAACARGDVVQSLVGQDLCRLGAQVQSEPVPGTPGLPGEPGAQGAPGPPPTAEQIRSAVDAYMARNPPPPGQAGRPPTAAEVAAAVSQYLTANPPAPGRPPTASEVENAAATYFATNPVRDGQDGEPGEDGAQGEPGRPPTAEEIRAAVAAELAENPPPAGEPGPTCVDGTSLQTVQFADGRFGLACVLDEQPQATTTVQPEPITEPDAIEGG